MKWFTSKARQRALKAERERDGFRRFFEKYREEAHELTVERDTALAERDEAREARDRFRSERDEAREERDRFMRLHDAEYDKAQALRGQLDHARALKESHHMRKRQAEQQLEAAELDNEALRDQLQSLTAERDALFNDLRKIKIIAANHTEETES